MLLESISNIPIPLCTDYNYWFLSQFRRDGCSFATVTGYSSTDNFLSPILFSDWLIFWLRNFDKPLKKKKKKK